jgi:hypothetical protein
MNNTASDAVSTAACDAVQVAEQLAFVREATNHNDGAWVEALLRVVGCKKGDPWCAAFVSVCLQIAHAGHNPLPMTASCEELHQFGRLHGLLVDAPQAGDVFLVLTPAGHAHHTGFCTGPAVDGRVPTIEGNTNVDGSRDGWGVFRRSRALNSSPGASPGSSRLVFLRPSERP